MTSDGLLCRGEAGTSCPGGRASATLSSRRIRCAACAWPRTSSRLRTFVTISPLTAETMSRSGRGRSRASVNTTTTAPSSARSVGRLLSAMVSCETFVSRRCRWMFHRNRAVHRMFHGFPMFHGVVHFCHCGFSATVTFLTQTGGCCKVATSKGYGPTPQTNCFVHKTRNRRLGAENGPAEEANGCP